MLRFINFLFLFLFSSSYCFSNSTWTIKDIQDSKKIDSTKYHSRLPKNTDPFNLFTIIEMINHSISIIDGDTFNRLKHITTHSRTFNNVKYSPDARFIYLSSHQGWIEKFDIYAMKFIGEIKVGLKTNNIAISKGGEFLAIINENPRNIVILDTKMFTPLAVIPSIDRYKKSSRINSIYQAWPRDSFIISFEDVPEIWEIFYKRPKHPVHGGLIHDYREDSGEGDISLDIFPTQKIMLQESVKHFIFDKNYKNLIAINDSEKKAHVINLNVRQIISTIDLKNLPSLKQSITLKTKDRKFFSFLDLKVENIKIGEPKSSHLIKKIKNLSSKKHRSINYFDLTKNKNYAIVNFSDDSENIFIFNTQTFTETKIIKMKGPIGIYNVYNTIQ